MRLRNLLFIFTLLLFACSKKVYDTSTLEKLVESMGTISQQPKTDNPLPYFYDKESASAIHQFDQAGENGLIAFDAFRNAVAAKFPNHTKRNTKGILKIALDGFAGMKVRSFSYSVSLVGPQLKKRKPSDYEFVSATKPDKNGVAQLTVKILGKEKTIPHKKTKEGYRMFLEKDAIDSFYNIVKQLEQLEKVFSDANQQIENGEITEDNFEEKMKIVLVEYNKALN